MADVSLDLISAIKARLPNALVSHYASPEMADFKQCFGALDLSIVDLVNVTGSAQLDYFGGGNSDANPAATYLSLHQATGLPIFVDTGFLASAVTNFGWLTVGADVVNQRIADGVVAVQVDVAPSNMQSQITSLKPQLTLLNCAL